MGHRRAPARSPRAGVGGESAQRHPRLRIETTNRPAGVAEPMHVHPRQESRAEVTAGTLRFIVDGRERRLTPGDAITVPAGVPH